MVSVFISYAHEDAQHMKTLCNNCGGLTQSHDIQWFDDTQIRSGDLWKPHIMAKLLAADGIVLLISQHFLGSGFCVGVELPEAKKCADLSDKRLIPVLIETVFYKSLQIDMYQLLPKDNNNDLKPVKDWRDKQKAWVQVVEAIYELKAGK